MCYSCILKTIYWFNNVNSAFSWISLSSTDETTEIDEKGESLNMNEQGIKADVDEVKGEETFDAAGNRKGSLRGYSTDETTETDKKGQSLKINEQGTAGLKMMLTKDEVESGQRFDNTSNREGSSSIAEQENN